MLQAAPEFRHDGGKTARLIRRCSDCVKKQGESQTPWLLDVSIYKTNKNSSICRI